MIAFVVRRLLASCVMLLVASSFVFVMLRVIPGDPTSVRAYEPGFTEELRIQLLREYELDKSIPEQYLHWLGDALTGNFGVSYATGQPMHEALQGRVVPTVELAIASLVVALLLAVPLALGSVLRPSGLIDRVGTLFAAAGMAMPVYWLGVLLIALLSVELGWLPPRGYVSIGDDPGGFLQHLAMPAVTMGVVVAAPVLRFLRSALLDESERDYMRTARGKGLTYRSAISRHALPNGVLPTVAYLGVVFGTLLGGVVIVEYVFGWPGLGALAVEAVPRRDYAILQAVVLFGALAYVVSTLLADIAVYLIDPRTRVRTA